MALSESEVAAVFMEFKTKLQNLCPIKDCASQEDFSQEVFLKFLSWSRTKNLRWKSPVDVENALLHCAKYVKKDWKKQNSSLYSNRIRLLEQTRLEAIPSRGEGHSSLDKASLEKHRKRIHHTVKKCLAGLDSSWRSIFFLKYGLGWPEKQIAQEVGLPLTTVRSRIPRLRRKIQVVCGGPPRTAGKIGCR